MQIHPAELWVDVWVKRVFKNSKSLVKLQIPQLNDIKKTGIKRCPRKE